MGPKALPTYFAPFSIVLFSSNSFGGDTTVSLRKHFLMTGYSDSITLSKANDTEFLRGHVFTTAEMFSATTAILEPVTVAYCIPASLNSRASAVVSVPRESLTSPKTDQIDEIMLVITDHVSVTMN